MKDKEPWDTGEQEEPQCEPAPPPKPAPTRFDVDDLLLAAIFVLWVCLFALVVKMTDRLFTLP